MKMGHSIEESKILIMDKLSQINPGNQYDTKDLFVERIFDNCGLHHVFADDSTFCVWYKITNKNNEQSIIEFKYGLSHRIRRLIDIDILFPFAKRDISTIENTTNHLLITTENGSGIYNLSEKKFDLEIGKITGITKVIRTHFCSPLGFCIEDIDAFLISNNEQKQGLYVSNYESLSIPIQYDEIYDNHSMRNRIFNERNMGTIYIVKVGDKLGMYMYRYFPLDETVLYNGDYEIASDDEYYNKMSVTTLPAVYDQIEFFHDTGLLKISENGKVGLYDIYRHKIIIPTIFDEISTFNIKNQGVFKAMISGEQYIISSKYGEGPPYMMHKVLASQNIEQKEPQKAKKLVNIGKKLSRYPDEEHRL